MIPDTTYEVVRTLVSSTLGAEPSPVFHLSEYDRISELPLLGAARGVHDTVIDVSEYAEIVGATMISGILLILAPAVLVVDHVLVPKVLVAAILTCTNASNARLYGAAVSELMGTMHLSARITVDEVPSHEADAVHVAEVESAI